MYACRKRNADTQSDLSPNFKDNISPDVVDSVIDANLEDKDYMDFTLVQVSYIS